MEYIQFGIAMTVVLLVFTAIISIWMKIANYIGGKLRIGEIFMNLYKSIGKDSK